MESCQSSSYDELASRKDESVAAVAAHVRAVCAANKASNERQARSLASNRPYQRLLLAAMSSMEVAGQPFTADLMLTVVQHLGGSATTPFSHAHGNGAAAPLLLLAAPLDEIFAWHLAEGGSDSGNGGAAARGRKRRRG